MSPPINGINHTKRAGLRDMKVFVLDNSLRESTVAQPAGHTLENKFSILQEIKKVGFQDVLVAAFGGDRRVDDAFCEHLKEAFSGEDAPKRTYAFSEITDYVTEAGEMTFGNDYIPTGLQKMKKYGIQNAVIEIDLNTTNVDWDGMFSVVKAVDIIAFLTKWTEDNLGRQDGTRRNFVNLRDFPLAMINCPKRVLDFVAGIAQLPVGVRPCGMIFEEPLGEYFPDEVANFTSMIRKTMDDNGWESKWQTPENIADGLLLYHTHEQYGFANATVMDALNAGADGMWCGLSEEGASMNHASSAVALTNLARLGNKDVLKRFNMKNLVTAARSVAMITTGKPVPSKQIVYGSGAVEVCFGFGGIAQGKRTNTDYNGDGVINDLDKFSVAEMIALTDPPARISTLASSGLVVKRLEEFFGKNDMFTEEYAQQLLIAIKRKLESNIKKDYNVPSNLAKLWNETFPLTKISEDITKS